MAKLILNNYNFNKNEIQNTRIQNLATAPASPVTGQVYYDTALSQFGCYQNTTWVYLSVAASANVTKAVNAAAANVMQVSGAADKSLIDYAGGAGLVKSAANGVVSAAVVGTDYNTNSSVGSFTNKTFDAAGTGNSITNLATSNFAVNVVDTDTALTANSDTRLASQKATKAYVDALSQGIRWKQPVKAATSAAGTLASSFANASVIDGVTLATGDRILIKDQAAGAENGLYTVNASGAPTRALDGDTAVELLNMVVDVQEGTVNSDQAFVLTNNTITLGTTALTYVDFVKAAVPAATTAVAGKVTLATLAQAEAKADTTSAIVAADLLNFPIKRIATIGDGVATAIAVTHSLGTKDVMAQVRDATTDAVVECDITNTSTTVTTFTFAVAPATNAYKVVIIG